MVTKWGLSEKLGPLMYDDESEEVFLGRSAGHAQKVYSPETAQRIDEEVRTIIDDCYEMAHQLLVDNMEKLHLMAEALMKYETIDSLQIDDIMAGKEPRPPKGWGDEPPSGQAAGGDSSPKVHTEKPTDTGIGGTAGEH